MSVLNTLLWWQWGLLALIPPAIILLYFLKLKRQPLEVPSTYLWSRTIEDLHVNTIWQRLRRNLLLFLQLLVVALIIFALLRPGWRGYELTDERFVLLIDNSASMSAHDQQPSRLDFARQKALEIVGQMRSGNSAMVISFSDTARVVQTYTESRRALRQQIEKIAPTARTTSLNDALRRCRTGQPRRHSSARQSGSRRSAARDTVPIERRRFPDGIRLLAREP